MSQYSQIAPALQTNIAAVSGIYNVVLKWPYTADIEDRESQWRDPDFKLHLWYISRRSQPSTPELTQTRRAGLWIVRGIFGVSESDNSETVFQNLIDAVIDAIDAEINIVPGFAYVTRPAELLEFITDDQQVGILAHTCLITTTIESVSAFQC